MRYSFLNFLKSLNFYILLTLSLGGLLSSCTPEEKPQQEADATDYPHKILFNCNEGNSVAKIYENGLIETLTLDTQGSGEILITNQEQNYILDSVSVEKEGFTKWTLENQIVQTEISFSAILEEEITEDYPHKILFNCNEGNSVAKIYENGLIETLTLDTQGSGEILITNQEQNYLLDSVSVEKEGFTKWTVENQIVQTEISFSAILEEEITEFDILVAYMDANNMDLTDILSGWVTSGGGLTVDVVDFSVADYYIMDFRGATDFASGHIKDAHNVVFTDLLTAAPADKTTKILCVCYTGQTAARATGFLRLAGYINAKTLKWGMCAWHPDFETKWETGVDNYASSNWITTGMPTELNEFDNPSFTTGNTFGEDILEARIQAVIGLPWIIDKTELLTIPSNYFINNKWPQACWDEYGHIANAYRIDEILGLSTLNNLNPEESVVTYCYAGHTSSITTAWLQVLGFDTAKSLKYGANAIVYSALLSGTAGAAPQKTWKGLGSGSELNFGYYDTTGTLHPPL